MRFVLPAMLALLPVPPAVAGAESPPPCWIAFAEAVQYNLKSWIEESDDPDAVRIRSALQARYSSNSTAEIRIRIWADDSGRVSRASFPDDPALDADLQSAIVGRTLDEAPPAGLRWPITFGLSGVPVIGAGKSSAPLPQPQ